VEETSNLLLPYILAAQAQKHVTHNEALRKLDALVQISIVDRDLSTPPSNPPEGARYIVAASPGGAWAGRTGRIAAWQDGAWTIYEPRKGWLVWIEDEGTIAAWNGAEWVSTGSGNVNPSPLVGVNTTADSTNRLAVASVASLFNHAGAGHQMKINKSTAADTASLLFQTGFSGRAEMGLAGSDNYSFKVSPNGSTWFEAILINRANGQVSFPNTTIGGVTDGDKGDVTVSGGGAAWTIDTGAVTNAKLASVASQTFKARLSAGTGDPEDLTAAQARSVLGVREVLTANRTYFVRQDGNDANDGLSNTSGGAFLTWQGAYDAICARIDTAGFTVVVQIADGTYTAPLIFNKAWSGGGPVVFQGNSGSPANVLFSTTNENCVFSITPLPNTVTFQGMELRTTGSGNCFRMNSSGMIQFGNVRFGPCAGAHLFASSGGATLRASGNYTISGGAQRHAMANPGEVVIQTRTVTLENTPQFTAQFALAARNSLMSLDGNTFSGAATGARYRSEQNSVIIVSGAGETYLPGNAAGSVVTGGLYL
jgi:hypothetical protein